MKIFRKLSMVLLVIILTVPAIQAGELAAPEEIGVAQGTGTSFFAFSEAGTNITVTASEEVRTFLVNTPGDIMIYLEAAAGQASSNISVSGLMPLTTYYTYVDHFYKKVLVTTDDTGTLTVTVDLVEPATLFVKNNSSTIFLSADPWVDGAGIAHPAGWSHSDGTDLNGTVGTWDSATLTAFLLVDVDELIEIISSNIILDGDGFASIRNPADPYPTRGIYTKNAHNITVRNMSFSGYYQGICHWISNGGLFQNLHFESNSQGILVRGNGNLVEDNTFVNNGRGVNIYPFSWINTVRDNSFTGHSLAGVYFWGLTGSNEIIDNSFVDGRSGISTYNSDYNTFTGNHFANNFDVGVSLGGSGTSTSDYNNVYNNNFVDNTTQANVKGVGNKFNFPAPDGGNFYSDWTGPDNNNDGFVDAPYLIYDYLDPSVITAQDDLPLTQMYGWLENLSPVIADIGPQDIFEFDTLNFVISATDPEGDNIVSMYAENLPAGATFNEETGIFQWQPGGTQAGVYVVSFYAVDDGLPSATGTIDVVINVSQTAYPEVCDGEDNDLDGDIDEDFVDTDSDGAADCVDSDDDNDGVLDVVDACPLVNASGRDANLDGCIDSNDDIIDSIETVLVPELQDAISQILADPNIPDVAADNIQSAIDDLIGNNGGGSNGATDKLTKEALIAALVKIKNAIDSLVEADLTSGVDTSAIQASITDHARVTVQVVIDSAEADWGANDSRVILAKVHISNGNTLASDGAYSAAISEYKAAVQAIQ